MRLRPLLLVPVVALGGCSGAQTDRAPGDPVTAAEAEVLAGLLPATLEAGGADFVATAPYGDGAVLTLTGEVDFARSVGRAQAVADPAGDGEPVTRTVFFTGEHVWFGDVAALPDALRAAGLPEADWVRRPAEATGERARLADAMVRLVLGLAGPDADDPDSFRGGSHTFQGPRSIDGELATAYAAEAGWTVAIDGSTDQLVQYAAELAGLPVTVTLADHGPRRIEPPSDAQSVDGAAHPEVAATVGL